jgi:hypothetical protein
MATNFSWWFCLVSKFRSLFSKFVWFCLTRPSFLSLLLFFKNYFPHFLWHSFRLWYVYIRTTISENITQKIKTKKTKQKIFLWFPIRSRSLLEGGKDVGDARLLSKLLFTWTRGTAAIDPCLCLLLFSQIRTMKRHTDKNPRKSNKRDTDKNKNKQTNKQTKNKISKNSLKKKSKNMTLLPKQREKGKWLRILWIFAMSCICD